jgi:uncharacterized protein (DUF362 family)
VQEISLYFAFLGIAFAAAHIWRGNRCSSRRFRGRRLVSMPKLKTHHWAGVTLSMKNMFGIVRRAILDINAAARPDFAIIDGILGMEGNGPIQGSPKGAGVLLFGDDPVAVDSTACRVMRLLPERVDYLARAGTMLGHVEASKIQQLGERIYAIRTPFAVLPEFARLVA